MQDSNILLDELTNQLIDLKAKHFEEENFLKERIQLLKSESRELMENYEKTKNEYIDGIKEIAAKIRTESKEKNALRDQFRLLDRNAKIKEHEERLIAEVCLKEDKAMLILNTAACNLQKLYRGRRDRALSALLREKKNRKGKKKGKGKG